MVSLFPFHWKGCFFMHHILLAINQISLSEIWKCVKKDGNSFFRSFPPLAVLSEGALWWNPSACTIGFAVLLSVYTVLRYLFRFHPAIKGDEHERRGYLRYWKRHNFEDEII